MLLMSWILGAGFKDNHEMNWDLNDLSLAVAPDLRG